MRASLDELGRALDMSDLMPQLDAALARARRAARRR
jgi:hypothetical protein